jgi:hypothetical protein
MKEPYADFAAKLNEGRNALHTTLLFFSNTREALENLLAQCKGFCSLHERSPQDLIFSSDLSIAYHFYRRSCSPCFTQSSIPHIPVMPTRRAPGRDGVRGEAREWQTIVAAVVLDKIWHERKSYGLFVLDFDSRVQTLRSGGYTSIYFEKGNFYLVLVPSLCIPIYILDFTFL